MRKLLLTIAATMFVACPSVWAQGVMTQDNTIYYNGLYYIPHADQGMTAHVAAPTTGNYGVCHSDDCWGEYTKPTGAVNIPMTIEFLDFTYTVTEIDGGAFSGCTGITSVHLPSTITRIEEGAFSGCTSLTSVNLPSSLTYIGNYAFSGCNALYSVTVPSNFTGGIDPSAFDGVRYVIYTGSTQPGETYGAYWLCRSVENGLYFSDAEKTTLVGGDLSLTSVNIPPSVTTIASGAFRYHPNITSVTVPYTTNVVGTSAFFCPNLTAVQWDAVNCNTVGSPFGELVPVIDANGYQVYDTLYQEGCYGYGCFITRAAYDTITSPITTFTIGPNVQNIPSGLAQGLGGITDITIPPSVKSIGSFAFAGTSITSLTLPSTLRQVCAAAFYCPNLAEVLYEADSLVVTGENVFSRQGNTYSYLNGTNIWSLGGVRNGIYRSRPSSPITTISVGNNVKRIPANLFRDLPTLTALSLGDSIRYVGDYAFAGDSNLTTLALPATLDTVGRSAFAAMGLTELTIPQNVRALGSYAFACPNLSSLVYNARRASIYYSDGNAFGSAPISSLTIGDSVESIPATFLSGDTLLTELTIPASVKKIGNYAFYRTRLASVTIPETIDTIESDAFSSINTLAEINFNATHMTSAGAAFVPQTSYWDYECDCQREADAAQQVLNIGANVRAIPYNIFARMNITSVQLPDSLEEIGQAAFAQCADLQSVVIPPSVQSVGAYAFAYSGLTSVLFEDDSTANNTDATIGASAFTNDYLTEAIIGNTVASIGQKCFENTPLQRVVIGPNVTTIGDKAFNGVTTVDTVFMQALVPPTIYANTFQSMPTNTKIMVPCGTKEDYEDAPYWNIFTRINEDASCFMLITANANDANMGSVGGGGRYSLGNVATLTAAPRQGFGFSGWADGSTDNPRLILVSGNASYTANFATMNTAAATDTVSIHDTTVVTDTLVLTDTLWLTQYDTAYITLTDTLTVVHTDTVTYPVYDTVTNTVYDTIDKYIYDTTIVTDTLWLTQYDTIWLHDTIYIHDTVVVGVDDVETVNAKIYSSYGQVVVEGSEGNMVTIYDMAGRVLNTKRDDYTLLRFDVPVSGTYLVKVGNAPARRIVVVK